MILNHCRLQGGGYDTRSDIRKPGGQVSQTMIYQFDTFTFHPHSGQIEAVGNVVKLRPKAAEVLTLLIENRERVLSKDDMIALLWDGAALSDGVLYECIRECRQALADSPRLPRFIKTYSKKGYQWVFFPVEKTAYSIPITVINRDQIAASSFPFPPSHNPSTPAPGVWQRVTNSRAAAPIVLALFALLALSAPIANRARRMGATEGSAMTLAILPLTDLTRAAENRWVEWGMRDLLDQHFEPLPKWETISMFDILTSLHQQNLVNGRGRPMTGDQASRLCRSLGANRLVETFITGNGHGLVAEAFLFDQRGNVTRIRVEARDIFELSRLLGDRLRLSLIESMPITKRPPLAFQAAY